MKISQSSGGQGAVSWWGDLTLPKRYWRWFENFCWIAGLAALGWVLFVLANTLYFQATQARRFAELRGTRMASAELHTGELLGKLTIARIGLSVVVLEGDDDKTLRHAVGHIPGTALPDATGTVALAGHRDTFFRNLGSLRENDVIVLETRKGTYRYRVATTGIVEPTDVAVLQSSGRSALTLVTCYPFYYIGPAPRRFVVTAWEVSDSKRPSSVRRLYARTSSQEIRKGG